MNEEILVLPIPSTLKPEVFSLLTPIRQQMLVSLLHEPKTVNRIIESIKEKASHVTILQALKEFEKYGCIKKDENRVYNLTTEGKFLALVLAKPNGMSKENLIQMFDELLKKDFELSDEDRQEIMSQWSELTGHMEWKEPEK